MTRHDRLRVAAAQYPIGQPATLDAWTAKVRGWVADGAATGAQVLVFPEYAAIEQAAAFEADVYGSLPATLGAVSNEAEARVALHVDLARAHHVHIIVGSGPVRSPDGTILNVAQVVTPNGGVGAQEKLIMTPFERDWGVSAGGKIRVFETELGRFGIAICYDSEFPLIARAMAEAGAELLFVPSCTERLSGYHRVRAGAMARALENQFAAVVSPTIGDALWSPAIDRNVGAATIAVPAERGISETGILAEGRLNEPGWVVADVDLAALRRLRTGGEMHNYADWARQPGLAKHPAQAEIVVL